MNTTHYFVRCYVPMYFDGTLCYKHNAYSIDAHSWESVLTQIRRNHNTFINTSLTGTVVLIEQLNDNYLTDPDAKPSAYRLDLNGDWYEIDYALTSTLLVDPTA